MRGSPVFMPNFIQICLYIIEKILETRQKRPNLGTRQYPALIDAQGVQDITKTSQSTSVTIANGH